MVIVLLERIGILPVLSHFILMKLRGMYYYSSFIYEITEACKSE